MQGKPQDTVIVNCQGSERLRALVRKVFAAGSSLPPNLLLLGVMATDRPTMPVWLQVILFGGLGVGVLGLFGEIRALIRRFSRRDCMNLNADGFTYLLKSGGAAMLPWSCISGCAALNDDNRQILRIFLRESLTPPPAVDRGTWLEASVNQKLAAKSKHDTDRYFDVDFALTERPGYSLWLATRACADWIAATRGTSVESNNVRPFEDYTGKYETPRARFASGTRKAFNFGFRDFAIVLGLAAVFTIGFFALVKTFKPRADSEAAEICFKAGGDKRIAACTRVIEGNAAQGNKAWAYNNRGNAYRDDKRDLDHALADYEQAIRLDPTYAFAYNGRGNVHWDKGEIDPALSDYDFAIRFDPKFAHPYNGRGNVYLEEGDLDRALDAYERAIRLDSNLALAFDGRGNVYRDRGDLAQALANYAKAVLIDPRFDAALRNQALTELYRGEVKQALTHFDALAPRDAYAAIWREIVAQRSDQPGALREQTAKMDMNLWPAPLIHMFLGQISSDDLLAAAEAADFDKKRGQVCEANLYIGEKALLSGAKEEAVERFKTAAKDCPGDYLEFAAARLELAALGVARSDR